MYCRFANKFPNSVAALLDREINLSRSIREETITDIMLATMSSIPSTGVYVDYAPDEARTGGDMDWYFVSTNPKSIFRIIVQAKRAKGRGGQWSRYSYNQLNHKPKSATKSGSGGLLQAESLVQTAMHSSVPCYPLYAFYNPERLRSSARKKGVSQIDGVNIADGYAIASLVTATESAKLKKHRFYTVGHLHNIFGHLHDIFCWPTLPYLLPTKSAIAQFVLLSDDLPTLQGPTPEQVRRELVSLQNRSRSFTDSIRGFEPRQVPEVTGDIPDDIMRAIEFHRTGLGERPKASRDRAIIHSPGTIVPTDEQLRAVRDSLNDYLKEKDRK